MIRACIFVRCPYQYDALQFLSNGVLIFLCQVLAKKLINLLHEAKIHHRAASHRIHRGLD